MSTTLYTLCIYLILGLQKSLPLTCDVPITSLLLWYEHKTPLIVSHYTAQLLCLPILYKHNIINFIFPQFKLFSHFEKSCLAKSSQLTMRGSAPSWQNFCGTIGVRTSGVPVWTQWSIITHVELGLNVTVLDFHMGHEGDWKCQCNATNTFSIWTNSTSPFGVFCGSRPRWMMLILLNQILLVLDATWYQDSIRVQLLHHAFLMANKYSDYDYDRLDFSTDMHPVYYKHVGARCQIIELFAPNRKLFTFRIDLIMQLHILVQIEKLHILYVDHVNALSNAEIYILIYDGPSTRLTRLHAFYCPENKYCLKTVSKSSTTFQVYILLRSKGIKTNDSIYVDYRQSLSRARILLVVNDSLASLKAFPLSFCSGSILH